jgi:hypothetical protein
MTILNFTVSFTDGRTNVIYEYTRRYTPKMNSDEDISCNHTVTAEYHCPLNVTARVGRVPFKEVFKGLKTIWGMKEFSAVANQFNTVPT